MKGRSAAAESAGWMVRITGAVIGWLTIGGLALVCVAIVATVALCIYAATLPK